jgi:glycosyltransferase involved in cell wall biosynthesis
MRILHVLGKLDRGGVETWLVQVLRHIDRQKYQMDFLVHTTERGAYDEEVKTLGARIVPCLRPSNPLQYAFNFQRALREYGPYDVVHSHVHHYSGYVLMLAAMAGVKVRIAHSHSDTELVGLSASPMRKAYRAAMRSLIRSCASGGLAVSTEAGDDLFAGPWRGSAKWTLHHLGIDIARFEAKVDSKALRQTLGIPMDAVVIGHVGRFTEEKNHQLIVEIAREVLRYEPRAFFLLVGDGPLRRSIEAKIARLSLQHSFLLTGVRADVPALMIGAMDAFVFTSLREGLPIELLEAQAAGLKCVVFEVISREADVIASLITRESPHTSAARWAQELLRVLSQPLDVSIDSVHRGLAARSIVASTEHLSSLYSTYASFSHT